MSIDQIATLFATLGQQPSADAVLDEIEAKIKAYRSQKAAEAAAAEAAKAAAAEAAAAEAAAAKAAKAAARALAVEAVSDKYADLAYEILDAYQKSRSRRSNARKERARWENLSEQAWYFMYAMQRGCLSDCEFFTKFPNCYLGTPDRVRGLKAASRSVV